MNAVNYILSQLSLRTMTKVVLCGYRDWAFQIFDGLVKNPNVEIVQRFDSNDAFLDGIANIDKNSIDVILFIGWSWIIDEAITERFLCVGIHPSDLPMYRGGTPIQHQVINGVKSTKVSLFTLSTKKLDAGEIWMKEDLSLAGDNMRTIFTNIVSSSLKLLDKFFTQFPNISPEHQDLNKGSYYKRRKPEESRVKAEDFSNCTLESLYNKIRCLTDPYPNAYIEDAKGNRLYFTGVRFEKRIN